MKFLYLSAFTLLFVGCVKMSPSTSYSLLSTNQIDISSIKSTKTIVEGESCSSKSSSTSAISNINVTMKKAIANAIENGKKKGLEGNILINATISQTGSNGIWHHKTCFKVSGELASIQEK